MPPAPIADSMPPALPPEMLPLLAASGLQPLEAGLVESGGTAYYFPKRESPKWSDDFSGLFTWNRPNAQLGGDGLGSSP